MFKLKDFFWKNLLWIGLCVLCLAGWFSIAQTEDVSARRVEDIEVYRTRTTMEKPTYCPESLPGSLSENGPCLVENDSPAETSSGAASVYLPLIAQQVPKSTRLGFGFVTHGGQNSIATYPEVDSLKAGWYLDWHARKYPPRPDGIEYVQMIHVHQKVTCGSHVSSDRVECPYVVPYEYEVRPSLATIAEIAEINPGSIWLVGNEIERLDWGTDEGPGGQDEILPTLYPPIRNYMTNPCL